MFNITSYKLERQGRVELEMHSNVYCATYNQVVQGVPVLWISKLIQKNHENAAKRDYIYMHAVSSTSAQTQPGIYCTTEYINFKNASSNHIIVKQTPKEAVSTLS